MLKVFSSCRYVYSYPFPSRNLCKHFFFNKHQIIFRTRKCFLVSSVLFHSKRKEVNFYQKILHWKKPREKLNRSRRAIRKKSSKCFLLYRSCALLKGIIAQVISHQNKSCATKGWEGNFRSSGNCPPPPPLNKGTVSLHVLGISVHRFPHQG